ncbi:hypothetical protein [Deinococcus kurensis]|uniref:hypothetical protein n=1 Tax=Deinococcus kurensis TaxID=2662757 RepID=UPI0012D2B933|nr:hypothetical protein [Deinococcus kurensis]
MNLTPSNLSRAPDVLDDGQCITLTVYLYGTHLDLRLHPTDEFTPQEMTAISQGDPITTALVRRRLRAVFDAAQRPLSSAALDALTAALCTVLTARVKSQTRVSQLRARTST